MAAALFVLGKVAFAMIGVAVGVRLAIATRRQGVGLHSVALAAICVGGLGLLAMPLARPLQSLPLALAGELGVRAGMLLLCVFVAGTFRPGRAGVAAAATCAALLLAAMVWDLLAQPSLLAYDYRLPSSSANQLSIALPFAWSTGESFVLWSRARRRLPLGLIDPVVAQGYLLWTVTTACFVAICALAIACGAAEAAGWTRAAASAQGTRGALYLVITACVWRGIFTRMPAPAAAAPTRA